MARKEEFALIQALTKDHPLPPDAGIEVGIGDDAAVVRHTAGESTVLSCDTMVENVHFNSWTMQPEDVGYKLMASNISDVLAMGGKPRYALIAVSIPRRVPQQRVKRIYNGIYSCADEYAVAVIGGDTTSAPRHLCLTVTIAGTVAADSALKRSAAKAGDAVFITGLLGQSSAGLDYLLTHRRSVRAMATSAFPEQVQPLVEAHRRPLLQPKAAEILALSGCHALNDISDGLVSEAQEIADASGYSLRLYEEKIPVAPALQSYAQHAGKSPLDWIRYGGEDYQLLGTVPKAKLAAVRSAFKSQGLPFYEIGEVAEKQAKPQVIWINRQGEAEALQQKGYRHF